MTVRFRRNEKYETGFELHLNPDWQITETKSKIWDITQRHLRKQNPIEFSEGIIVV